MSSVVKKTVQIINDLSHGDPRMNDYFLMKSPLEPILVLTLYLLFVLKVGPQFMAKRKPYNIKPVLIIYNLVQIFANLFVFIQTVPRMEWFPLSNIICYPQHLSYNPEILYHIKLHYYYVLLKFFDLFDTIFFVLRKKHGQISYLHVHHHVGILTAAWISGKYFPLGQSVFTGFFNTFIHFLMYFYYLLTTLDFANLWWKKYLTLIQIVQQYLIFFATVGPVLNESCPGPRGINVNWPYSKQLAALYLCNVCLVIYLFTRFYIKSYLKNNNHIKKN